MLHDLEFNGQKLLDFGAVITEKPKYSISVRDITMTSVLGRSGDVIVDNNRYKNVELSYKIAVVPMFSKFTEQEFIYKLSEWLMSEHDYKILRDTYNNGYFRKAVCTSISNPTTEISGVVTATITFNCDPFLYSDVGTVPITFDFSVGRGTQNFTLRNPEKWASAPTIKITGTDTFIIGCTNSNGWGIGATVTDVLTITADGGVYDSNGTSAFGSITQMTKLPFLPSGTVNLYTTATNGSNAFSIEITPNWRRL